MKANIVDYKQNSSYAFGDFDYHKKQKTKYNIEKSIGQEFLQNYKEIANLLESRTEASVNTSNQKDLFNALKPRLSEYRKNSNLYCNNTTINRAAIDRDPLLSKLQKSYFEDLMEVNLKDPSSKRFFKNSSTGFMRNSYSPAVSDPLFMIRAISYIYPVLIVKPLPRLTWREDWDVFSAGSWAEFNVFPVTERVYPATISPATTQAGGESPLVDSHGTTSPRVNAKFGESVFQNVTLRTDVIWDSTVLKMQDETMNNGLINYVYMESLRRGFDEQINNLYLFGSSAIGTQGLLNNTNIQTVSSLGSWNQKNPSTGETYATQDLVNLTQAVQQNSLGAFDCTNLMFSLLLNPPLKLPRSAQVSSSSVTYLLGQYLEVLEKATFNPYLNNQGTAGAQVAVAYDKNINNANIGVPQFMFAEPVTYDNNRYRMPFITRSSGFQLIQAPSIAIMNNISIAT